MLRRLTESPWPLAAVVFTVGFARTLAAVVPAPLQRFDHGMEMASVIFVERGLVNFSHFYMPQGPALGLPGVLPDLLDMGVVGHRGAYSIFVALAMTLPVVIAHRFQGFWVAVVVALLCLPHDIVRYSLAWCGLLAGVVLLEAVARRSESSSLRELAEKRPRALAGVSAVVSFSGWARIECVAFGLAWAAILVLWLRGRARWVQVGLAAFLALLPILLIAVTGGLHNLADWVSWSRNDFPERRAIPIDWGTFPDYVRALLAGDFFPASGHAFVYVLATVAVVGAAIATLRWPRNMAYRAMSLGVVPLLGAAAAFVVWTSAQRWGLYATASLPVFAAALAVVLPRDHSRLRVAALCVLVLGAVTVLGNYRPSEIRQDLAADSADDAIFREQVKNMAYLPLEDWASFNALRAQWKKHGHEGSDTLATTLHNDAAVSNDPIVHWLLRAGPAAYPTIYDPGYSDEDRIQREAVEDLCRSRAPIIQSEGDYPDYGTHRPKHGSRRLDVHMAWNTRIEATGGFYRIRTLERPRCSDPYAAPPAALGARREELMRRGDATGAGALATVEVDRARAAGRPAALDDLAVALLGGFYVEDEAFPRGELAMSLRTVRDGAGGAPGGLRRRAVVGGRDQPPEVRAALHLAWRQAPEGDGDAVVGEMQRLLRERPHWPVTVENLTGVLGPVPAGQFAELAGRGRDTPVIARARIDAALRDGDRDAALEAAAVLFPTLFENPVLLGKYEEGLANVINDPQCAEHLRRRADARPGVRVAAGSGPAPSCALPLPPAGAPQTP